MRGNEKLFGSSSSKMTIEKKNTITTNARSERTQGTSVTGIAVHTQPSFNTNKPIEDWTPDNKNNVNGLNNDGYLRSQPKLNTMVSLPIFHDDNQQD